MEWLLLWMASGVLCAVIASSRGRSTVGWLLLGALFGIFAIVGVIALPTVTSDEAPPASTHKKCPFCAEFIRVDAKVCKHCGRDLPQVAPEPLPEPSENGRKLVEAARAGNWATAFALLNSGVSANSSDFEGHTALDVAIERGDEQLIQLLKSRGARSA